MPGDWTIECWFYSTATFNTSGYFLELNYTAAGRVSFVPVPFGNRIESATAVFTNNTWNHIAYVRNGTTVTIYVNGTSVASGTASVIANSEPLTIGQTGNGWNGRYYFNGYISDFRFVKGTAVYTANFTPPTQPLSAVANTQLLTLQYKQPHNNHSFQDSSSNNHLITRSGNATQGTFSPFSQTGWGNYFKTGTDAITSASSSGFAFGTGNYTIEAQIYWSGSSSEFQITGSSSNNFNLYVNTTTIGFYDGTSGITRTTNISKNTWLYIALVRSGGSLTFYLNGSAVGSTTASSTNYSAFQLIVGRNTAAGTSWADGCISNLRISNVPKTRTQYFYLGTQIGF